MQRSTLEEIRYLEELVHSTRAKITELIQNGKKVHVIWDFDGVLADSRSDDVFRISGYDLKAYFEYEERLVLERPRHGLWYMPIAHTAGRHPDLPRDRFSQDVVTARSSLLSMRVQIFCLSMPVRWMLFLGHQPKQGSYRMILESLNHDPDYYVLCIDDSADHIKSFERACRETGMEDRSYGILSPVTRTYSENELREYFDRIMNITGGHPMRVRDPSNDTQGSLVLPDGRKQFETLFRDMVSAQHSTGHHFELRKAFTDVYGDVGGERFKTEEDLELTMQQFIIDRWT